MKSLCKAFEKAAKNPRSTSFFFLAITIFAFCIRPSGWLRFTGTEAFYFDVGNYIHIATNGYTDPHLTVFSPLWPLILSLFNFFVHSQHHLVFVAGMLSTIFCILSIHVFFKIAKIAFSERLNALIIILFVFSPLAIFRINGYAESLSTFLCCIFLLTLLEERPSFIKIFILSLSICMTRPLAIFFAISALATVILMVVAKDDSLAKSKMTSYVTFAGAACAFLFMGLFCLFKFDHFLAFVTGQRHWGRKLGFYPEIFFNPTTVGGSDDVLVWDLLAMYGSCVMLGWIVVRILTSKRTDDRSFTALFSACVCTGLVFASIFTYPKFMSLSRHVFALPFFYFAFGYILNPHSRAQEPSKRILNATTLIALLSIAYYFRFVLRYAKGSWAG